MPIYIRGNVNRKGDTAPSGFLQILRPANKRASQKFTRLDLANAICSAKNPLTARVIVNRVWQHHFGRGIVATASNFGAVGNRPGTARGSTRAGRAEGGRGSVGAVPASVCVSGRRPGVRR